MIRSDLVRFGQIWSDSVGFGQIRSDLIRFDRIEKRKESEIKLQIEIKRKFLNYQSSFELD